MGIKLRTIRTDTPHPYPYELDCMNCEDWTPAYNLFRVDGHEEYFVCVFCGWETDGEHVIDVAEVYGYRQLYEAQQEDVKFYREFEEPNDRDMLQ
jgi:hypothetical protein